MKIGQSIRFINDKNQSIQALILGDNGFYKEAIMRNGTTIWIKENKDNTMSIIDHNGNEFKSEKIANGFFYALLSDLKEIMEKGMNFEEAWKELNNKYNLADIYKVDLETIKNLKGSLKEKLEAKIKVTKTASFEWWEYPNSDQVTIGQDCFGFGPAAMRLSFQKEGDNILLTIMNKFGEPLLTGWVSHKYKKEPEIIVSILKELFDETLQDFKENIFGMDHIESLYFFFDLFKQYAEMLDIWKKLY